MVSPGRGFSGPERRVLGFWDLQWWRQHLCSQNPEVGDGERGMKPCPEIVRGLESGPLNLACPRRRLFAIGSNATHASAKFPQSRNRLEPRLPHQHAARNPSSGDAYRSVVLLRRKRSLLDSGHPAPAPPFPGVFHWCLRSSSSPRLRRRPQDSRGLRASTRRLGPFCLASDGSASCHRRRSPRRRSNSTSKLKQLILTSDRHGRGRTRGRGPREGIAISNVQSGEDYTDENAMIPQNTTVLVRRIAGQLSENIVLVSSRKVTEGCSVPSSKSVVTDSSSKSLSSMEVQDEDAAIAAVIDAAELKLDDHQSKGQAGGRFTSGNRYGHGPLEGESPPPGYVCRSCGVPGHFIQHCTQEKKAPPPGYICYRCRIPGHFIQHCPTIGDANFDKNKMLRSLAPVVTPSAVDGILESLVSAPSASAVDDLPAELHCRLCKKVMTDAVLTSKCCFDSFCDKCIRDYIITQSKCVCGANVLADSLIPNHTLRSTISNMLSTRAGSTSGTTKHRSSSGSNPDPKLQNHAPSAASERVEMKQSMNLVSEAAGPCDGLQVARKDDLVNQSLEKLAANVDLMGKDEVSSAEVPVEKTAGISENLKLQDGSESTLKVTTTSGTLVQNATKTDQPKKKRKKAASAKIVQPNGADFGYNVSMDPAYYNPFVGGYPWAPEPYMYGSLGVAPYGGYPMGPYGVNPMNSMPQQALPLPMNGYPQNYHWHEAQPTLQRGAETALHPRLSERLKDTGIQSRSSECHQKRGSSHGSELRNRTKSSPERRDHWRSDRASDDYHEDHSRKRVRLSSPMDGDKQSSGRPRHSSSSMTHEDSSDDERNFKRRWGRRSSVTVDSRR